jgi:uncharacterized protein YyaL (SSP411 family)
MQRVNQLFLLSLWLLCAVPPVSANQLAKHESPYLAMHGQDPVDWHLWSAEALAQARREHKLLFVSIGYFSCHWCHVMHRESYQDAQVAKLLNEYFIPVKVDRELNPALDAYLLDFVQRTRGISGWPLNVFLTPDGHPLVGLIYLPKDDFLRLLQQLQQQWQQSAQALSQLAASDASSSATVSGQQAQGQSAAAEPPLTAAVARGYETLMVQQALQLADELEGGFGDQSKFPMVPQLDSLLSAYQHQPGAELKHLLTLTLDRMATQGLRDHLGGGFFRYTVDPGWQMPHFEKMLYDNALLAMVYLRAAIILERPDYELVARDTLDFMVREMSAPSGAMVASFSAIDDAGVEGGYYLWQPQTLAQLLSADELQLIQQVWGLTGQASFDAGYLPRQQMTLAEAAKELAIDEATAEQGLQAAKQKLLAARGQRHLPVDGKQLAAWNGLALTALLQGARLEGGTKYRTAAKKVRDYLVNALWDGQRLQRARGKRGALGQAGLEDYAFAAQGLLAWATLTEDDRDSQLARRWLDAAWQRFHDKQGWRRSDQALIATGKGQSLLDEGPLPSPAAVLMRLTLSLRGQDSDTERHSRAQAAMMAGHSQLAQTAFDYPSLVRLLSESAYLQ